MEIKTFTEYADTLQWAAMRPRVLMDQMVSAHLRLVDQQDVDKYKRRLQKMRNHFADDIKRCNSLIKRFDPNEISSRSAFDASRKRRLFLHRRDNGECALFNI